MPPNPLETNDQLLPGCWWCTLHSHSPCTGIRPWNYPHAIRSRVPNWRIEEGSYTAVVTWWINFVLQSLFALDAQQRPWLAMDSWGSKSACLYWIGFGVRQTDTMRFYPTGMGFQDFFLKKRRPLTAVDQLCMDLSQSWYILSGSCLSVRCSQIDIPPLKWLSLTLMTRTIDSFLDSNKK
jgi:hypothetical protein